MKKKLLATLLTLVLSMSLSVPAFAEETTTIPSDNSTTIQQSIDGTIVTPMTADSGYINANGVRLRASASTSGTVRGLLYSGTQVEVGDVQVYADGMYWNFVI